MVGSMYILYFLEPKVIDDLLMMIINIKLLKQLYL